MISDQEGWAIGQGFLPLSSPVPLKNGGSEQQGTIGKLLLHYSHGEWTIVDHGTTDPTFETIAMSSPTNGWMLGSNGAENTLLHYEGTRWQVLPLPGKISTTPFMTLTPISDKEVWLAGDALAHYDGTTWTQRSLPAPHLPSSLTILRSLCMISPHEGWTVGDESNTSHGVILHIIAGQIIVQSQLSTPF